MILGSKGWQVYSPILGGLTCLSVASAPSSRPRRTDSFLSQAHPQGAPEHTFPMSSSSLRGYNPVMLLRLLCRLPLHQTSLVSTGRAAPAAKRMRNYCDFCHLVQTHPMDTLCCRHPLYSLVAGIADLPSKTPQKSPFKGKPAKQMENAFFV